MIGGATESWSSLLSVYQGGEEVVVLFPVIVVAGLLEEVWVGELSSMSMSLESSGLVMFGSSDKA